MPAPRLRRGLRVLVTRPAAQAEPLCAAIEAAGGVPIRFPLLSILPCQDPSSTAARLRAQLQAQWWIFTSANAVQHAHALLPGRWGPQLAAIGAATAAALAALGRPVAVLPQDGASSEALLATPAFARLQGAAVALVTGAGGRGVLPRVLRERGARVDVVEVYRRAPVPHAPARVVEVLEEAEVAVVTSGEALVRLVALTPAPLSARLLDLQLVLPSARVVEQALQLGFVRPPWVAEPMSDAAILRCLGDDQTIQDP